MRYNLNLGVLLLFGIALAASTLFSQASKAAKPSFEVASVKRNLYGAYPGGIAPQRDRITAYNITLTTLVQFAYHQPADQKGVPVLGASGWMDSEHYDIEAKPEAASRVDEMRLMLQSLLEDRFQLRLHRETREFPVYTLSVGKDGPKLEPSTDQSRPVKVFPPGVPIPRGAFIERSGNDLIGTAVDMSFLAGFLAQQLDRPVIDRTNLKGPFDFRLHYTVDPRAYFNPGGLGRDETPSPGIDPSGASIFTAVQEIGLELEASTGPVEVLVIDSVRKPTEN